MRAKLDKLLLLARTLIWLKPVQIYGRLWFRLYRPRPRRFNDAELTPAPTSWRAVSHASTMSGPATFTFLNRSETLASPGDWNASHLPKLWLYNAHYLDDLVAANASHREQWHRDLINRWIAENPPGTGNGWEPYPTSLRIVNLSKRLLSGNYTATGLADSLATQADWLSRRLEHHLLGNHLFANAKALVFAGCVLSGPIAARLRKKGLQLLKREMPEQILPDGGHFERSIMYHAILTEDVLDLIQLAQLFPDAIDAQTLADWETTANRMLHFLSAMSHPDRQIAFFNDGAFGIAPEPDALHAQGAILGIKPLATAEKTMLFRDTGYARLTSGPALVLADVAPIGPDYLPGHAHADTLSFEFSLGEQRIFVNGGTSVYGGDPMRRMQERSTAYHNTVCVQDTPSSEIWSDFRVARRAKLGAVDLRSAADSTVLAGTHYGYRHISGPDHSREWVLAETSLIIHDRLTGPVQPAIARYRIHPDLKATPEAIYAERTISIQATGGTLTLEDGEWSPEFGKIVPCQILTLALSDQNATMRFSWEH